MKFGNLPTGLRRPSRPSRAPSLASLITPDSQPVGNAVITWAREVVDWPMALNDKIGCCAIAGVAHADQVLGTIGGAERIMSNDEVQTNYERFGYVPGPTIDKPDRDPGCELQDVLAAWAGPGLLIGGTMDKIDAYASISPLATLLVRRALRDLGVVYMGVALPIAAQSQDVWDVPTVLSEIDQPGTWGGHCMLLIEAEPDDHPDNLVTFVTWGTEHQATWRWWREYAIESYGVFHPVWAQNGSLSGFDAAQAKAAIDALTTAGRT